MFQTAKHSPENAELPREIAEFLDYTMNRYGQKAVAGWLGTARQHVPGELPKVARYAVALTAAIGPAAAQAIQAALCEGLRRHYAPGR